MPWPEPATPGRVVNRVLEGQAWARDRLAPFAGRTFSLRVGPWRGGWRIGSGGLLEDAQTAAPIDLSLTLSPWSVPAFLANPSRWNEYIHEDGDVSLGGALKDLARTLPWFVEEMLAARLGPLAGQRVADAGRRLLAFPEYATERITESVVSYGRDEAQVLARGDEMRQLAADVQATVGRTDELAARIDALAARDSGTSR